jgi:diguanylate cyclase (GGDEF)-like protein
MFSDLFTPPRLHTRIVTAYVALLIAGQALTFWLIQRGIERNVRLSVHASLITTERWLQRQLPASSIEPDTAHSPPGAPAEVPTTADVRLRGVLQDIHELLGPDVLLMVRQPAGQGPWRLHSSTLEPPVAQTLLPLWLESEAQQAVGEPDTRPVDPARDPADRTVSLPHGEHLGRAFTLSSPNDPHEVRAVVLSSLDDVRATYQHLKHTLLGLSVLGIVAFGVVGLITARRLTRPLRKLSDTAEKLKRGDYDSQVPSGYGGEIGELAESFETMRQALQDRDGQIRRLATRDRLTDLPNRDRFRQELRHALERAGRKPTAVLMLDMDRFKHVNDQLGHRFGDGLLKAIAERLRDHAKDHGRAMLARLGGDEFGLLLPRTDTPGAHRLAQRILADFERPIQLDGHKVDLSAGIGIACAPDHGEDVDTLLSRAELAMYAAKQRRAGAVVYQRELDPESGSSLTLLGELRQAVDQGELRLFLQPKVSLRTGRVVGAEALVRWEHPVRGVLPPHGFVPFAEQTGFVRLLTGWMLEEVTRTARQLADLGLDVKLSVNLSTRDLMDQTLPERLEALIDEHSVAPDRLVLEITESAIMDDPRRAQMTLERLHAMGLRLSIDDFGTGYASLAYLKALPVDELKIDRSFVQDMALDGHDAKIVSSTIELAHSIGLTVVAEGVEDEAAWHRLAKLGCDEAQGHLVARPMPADLFAGWATGWQPPAAG